MILYIKQKVFSWRTRFFVKDEAGSDRYAVQGELLSLGRKLHVYDARGDEVAFIRQKLVAFRPRYIIEVRGRPACELVQELSFFKPRYRLEGTGWRLEGDIWAHSYTLTDGGYTVMRMAKEWFTWGDSYALHIADPADELLCLCITLAVDCVIEGEKSD